MPVRGDVFDWSYFPDKFAAEIVATDAMAVGTIFLIYRCALGGECPVDLIGVSRSLMGKQPILDAFDAVEIDRRWRHSGT